MPLIIKGKLIDESSPIPCVSLMETTHENIMAAARRMVVKGVEMVEWRADYYERLADSSSLKQTLLGLKSILSHTVFLATIRTIGEGGKCDLDSGEIRRILYEIADSGCADIIDVEYFGHEDPAEIISHIQSTGCSVISSHHNFQKTPTQGVMVRLMEEMKKADPDIIKLCVMPNALTDVNALIGAIGEFKSQNRDSVLIGISMGKYGVITRLAPRALGSAVTFAAIDNPSAPGQVEYTRLKEILEMVKEFYK